MALAVGLGSWEVTESNFMYSPPYPNELVMEER